MVGRNVTGRLSNWKECGNEGGALGRSMEGSLALEQGGRKSCVTGRLVSSGGSI